MYSAYLVEEVFRQSLKLMSGTGIAQAGGVPIPQGGCIRGRESAPEEKIKG